MSHVIFDGCCGAGGGARGYATAGHYVVGADTDPSCRDAYLRSGAQEFVHGSVLELLADTSFMARFTVALVNPPCQGYSGMMACQPPEVRARYPRLIRQLHPLLDALGLPFVIENVEGARRHMRAPVTVCMWMFGRATYRHRLLEAGGGLVLVPPAPGPAAWQPPPGFAPARRIRADVCGWPHPVPTAPAGHWTPGRFVSVAGHERKGPVRGVMEIDEGWMPDRETVAEAIPPYLGAWVIGQVPVLAAAGRKHGAYG